MDIVGNSMNGSFPFSRECIADKLVADKIAKQKGRRYASKQPCVNEFGTHHETWQGKQHYQASNNKSNARETGNTGQGGNKCGNDNMLNCI